MPRVTSLAEAEVDYGDHSSPSIYVKAGYTRSYESMCKQLKKLKNYEKPKKTSYPKSKYKPLKRKLSGGVSATPDTEASSLVRACRASPPQREAMWERTSRGARTPRRPSPLCSSCSARSSSATIPSSESGFSV